MQNETLTEQKITINGQESTVELLEEIKKDPKKKVIKISETEYKTKELLFS